MSERVPVYLDNAATTRPLPAVVDAMARAMREDFGNPSSAHTFGKGPKKALEDAREFLRGTLGAARVVFTSGGSEADLLGVVGAGACRPPGRVLAAASDHPAVLRLGPLLGRYRHHFGSIPVTRFGDPDPETLFEHLGADVRVISLLHGHNELGTLSRLEELVSLVRRVAPDAHVHVDLVQSYGKIPFDLDAAGVDSVAVSAHKLHGPRGVGILALSSVARVEPLQEAGGQEGGLRGGTENVAGAVGLMMAAETALTHQARNHDHMEELAAIMEEQIRRGLGDVERLGHAERRLPHILSMRIPGVRAATLLERCDARGLAFSTGSACHGSRGEEQSENHVLAAIGMDRRQAGEVARFSFCPELTREEVTAAAAVVIEEARALRELAPQRGRSRRKRSPAPRASKP